ncbi:chemotaxis protein [Lysinibacillus fusiformis]|nr:chemotaxis protein [Lysinibacillus fusiformis]
MSIGKKLNFIFFTFIFLLCSSMFIMFLQFSNIEKIVKNAIQNRVSLVELSSNIQFELAMQGLFMRATIIEDTSHNKDSLYEYAKRLDEHVEEITKKSDSPEMDVYTKDLNTYNDSFNKFIEEAIALADVGNREASLQKVNEAQQANTGLLEVSEKIVTYQKNQLEMVTVESKKAVNFSQIISIVAIVLGIIIGLILIFYVQRAISNPLKSVVSAANNIANGELYHKDIFYQSKDEIGQLTKSFNKMKNHLHDLLIHIQGDSEHLMTVAEELSASTEGISSTTGEIGNRINETAEAANAAKIAANESAQAMDETASGVQRIAEATQQLHHNALTTTEIALNGNNSVEKAKHQMTVMFDSTQIINELVQKLSKQSAEINNITEVITAITDQTNLLALNAAIEAARAGENGKGFAVVADEVRKLAEESKQSANKIVSLTQDIQQDTKNVEKAVIEGLQLVTDGVKIIGGAGQAFNSIGKAIHSMTGQISDISATSEEISASAEQVAASVAEIACGATTSSSNTQIFTVAIKEQAATMQQVNLVATDLNNKSVSLQNKIKQFKL